MMRIGFGYDSHRFIDGDHIMMGGVRLPYTSALKAHSDGDVLLHAVADALLGAAALGDLGQHFPDTDPDYQSANSADLVKKILSLLDERQFAINNIDSTIIAEAPKFSPYMTEIRHSVAEVLGLPVSQVSVKATTNEQMGWIGRGEGIAVHAVVLLSSSLS
jgi:2-C-methyl-D-erythritol 2,4-cyclodiphosphate synthase